VTAALKPSVRLATADDIPAMHRIRLAVRENRLSVPGRITEDMYRPYVAQGSAWVAETDGKLAGFAILDASAGTVWALFVDPQAQGLGIGTALHERLLSWARERGIERLSLTTAPGTRAEHFYTAAGWEKAGLTSEGEVPIVRELRQP
jgi:GNAT superfamily N-acetyltransferase